MKNHFRVEFSEFLSTWCARSVEIDRLKEWLRKEWLRREIDF